LLPQLIVTIQWQFELSKKPLTPFAYKIKRGGRLEPFADHAMLAH
jgi:hypothetical protein